jgi:seryl-tRNA(Sec) selenium transferase
MPRYSAVVIYNQSNFSIAAIIVKMHEKKKAVFHRGSSVTHVGAVMMHT